MGAFLFSGQTNAPLKQISPILGKKRVDYSGFHTFFYIDIPAAEHRKNQKGDEKSCNHSKESRHGREHRNTVIRNEYQLVGVAFVSEEVPNREQVEDQLAERTEALRQEAQTALDAWLNEQGLEQVMGVIIPKKTI